MQRAQKPDDQEKTDRRNTGGLPIARDATPPTEAGRTAERRDDRDDPLGVQDQNRDRQGDR